eukprot:jgi/Chlat1/2279/Chrsp17S02589
MITAVVPLPALARNTAWPGSAASSSSRVVASFNGLRQVPAEEGQDVGYASVAAQALQRRSSRKPVRFAITAQWGAEVAWNTVNVAEKEQVAEQLYKVVVDVSKVKDLKYEKPGQFVQFKVEDSKPAFIAIASAPKLSSSGGLEFLIKYSDGTAGQICGLPKGAAVNMSAVMGKGFNVDRLQPAEDRPAVVLFATGSGISPIRSLVEEGVLQGERSDVRLYYGARTPAHMAYMDKFKEWEAAGIRVIPVMSQPEDCKDWTGHTGYVQAAYASDAPVSNAELAAAVLVGQKAMTEEVIKLLQEQGVSRENILMNF